MLNDTEIRLVLKSFLASQTKPKRLIEELRINNGNSIADIVAIHKALHGYEIKGEKDNPSRLKIQTGFYNSSFRTLTLVTTQNHLNWAINYLPHHWGIIVARKTGSTIKLTYNRGAKTNRDFKIDEALKMLWRDELVEIGTKLTQVKMKAKDSRADLINKIAPYLSKSIAGEAIAEIIMKRVSTSYL